MITDETILRCVGLCAGYGREIVLRDVNLEIPRSIYLPFVGANGAGKTTLLRCILGLVKIQSGKLETNFHKYPVAYVPQQESIDPLFPLSVFQIVTAGLYRKLGWWHLPSETDKKHVERIIARLNLSEHADKNYRELSGGTKQKVLVARALVSNADVLIMDEPAAELDEESENEVFNCLRTENKECGKTVLFSCHESGIEKFSSEAVCVVNHGKARIMRSETIENRVKQETI
ncbi:MAG: ATP-binding cassette domain-containing protein [Planctomycetota bacterium]